MKVNVALEFSETDLRRLRARLGRGGKATRKEARIWIDGLVRESLTKMPEPKVKRKLVAECRPAAPAPTADAICAHCTKSRGEHSTLMGLCPLSRSYGKHTRFKAVMA